MARLDDLEAEANKYLRDALARSKRALLAFSGGKDAIVVAHLASNLGVKDAVCEVSFYFERQLKSIKSVANHLSLNCEYKESLSMDWLRKHPNVIFSDDTSLRSWTFAQRQQTTVKKHAKKHGYDLQIFGRRTEENSVPKAVYETNAGLQCHPIRNWKTADVWAYFEKHRIPIPWIYSTRFGELEGNAPFYTLNRKDFGGSAEQCWELVRNLDSRYHPGMLNGQP